MEWFLLLFTYMQNIGCCGTWKLVSTFATLSQSTKIQFSNFKRTSTHANGWVFLFTRNKNFENSTFMIFCIYNCYILLKKTFIYRTFHFNLFFLFFFIVFCFIWFPGLPGYSFQDSFPSLISWTARFSFPRKFLFFWFPGLPGFYYLDSFSSLISWTARF